MLEPNSAIGPKRPLSEPPRHRCFVMSAPQLVASPREQINQVCGDHPSGYGTVGRRSRAEPLHAIKG